MALLLPAVDDLAMSGAVVDDVDNGARLQRNVADGIILTHEGPDRVDAVEPHQGLELDLPAEVALHQVHVHEARDLPRLDARNHFVADDALIGVRVLRRGPAAPETTDHQTRIGMR